MSYMDGNGDNVTESAAGPPFWASLMQRACYLCTGIGCGDSFSSLHGH